MTEPMSDERLAAIEGILGLPYRDQAPYMRAANRDLLREVERARAEQPPLRTEYGIRAEYVSTRLVEFTVADNLGDALAALAEFDEKHSDRVVKRCLIQRPVGDWEELGTDA